MSTLQSNRRVIYFHTGTGRELCTPIEGGGLRAEPIPAKDKLECRHCLKPVAWRTETVRLDDEPIGVEW